MNKQKRETSNETQVSIPATTVPLLGPVVILKKAGKLYRERLNTLLGVMIGPVVLALLFSLIFPGGIHASTTPFLFGMGSLFLMIVQLMATIALLYVVTAEESITVKEAYQKAPSIFFAYVWISILVGAVTVAGLILFIIPGIIFSVWFSLAVLVLIIEDKRGVEALKASRAYVKGHWWAVFGRLASIIATVLAVVVAFVVFSSIFSFIPGLDMLMSDVGGAVVSLFLTPLILCYMYYLYQSVRSLKSSL